jgi:hypothetical protein
MAANVTCPYCQAPLSVTEQPGARTLHCPHCLADIEDPRMGPAAEAPNVLRDIRRSGHSLRWWSGWLVLGLLAALCVAHIAYVKVEYMGQPSRDAALRPLAFCPGFLGLDVLALVAIGIALRRWLLPPGGVTAAGLTTTLKVALLTLLLSLAVAVFFFAVCTALS